MWRACATACLTPTRPSSWAPLRCIPDPCRARVLGSTLGALSSVDGVSLGDVIRWRFSLICFRVWAVASAAMREAKRACHSVHTRPSTVSRRREHSGDAHRSNGNPCLNQRAAIPKRSAVGRQRIEGFVQSLCRLIRWRWAGRVDGSRNEMWYYALPHASRAFS